MKGEYKSYSRLVSLKTNSLNFFIISILLISCGENSDNYVLRVYPDKTNLLNDISLEGYTSLENCRLAANKMIYENKFTNADYECGKNCRKVIDPQGDYFICQESSR